MPVESSSRVVDKTAPKTAEASPALPASWVHRRPRGGRPVIEECSLLSVADLRDCRPRGVRTVAAEQPFGGTRRWIVCPDCTRRRAALVALNGGGFACRVCVGVHYRSQHVSPTARVHSRLHKLVERLGGLDARGVLRKPRFMRWRTYRRIFAVVAQLQGRVGDHWRPTPDPRMGRHSRQA